MGFLLFIISIILNALFTAFSLVFTPIYYIITLKWRSGTKQLDRYFLKLAVSLDQFGNAACSSVLQLGLSKKDINAEKFGNEDDTVSYILGRLKHQQKLTKLGKLIVWILDNVERDHTDKAIVSKIKSDQEAILRIQEDKYFK